MKLLPLRFAPIYKEKIWGGRRLERCCGRSLPAERAIGESWEIADHGDDVSRVQGGPFDGKSLRALMTEYPHELLGADVARKGLDRFPLLIKLIDASHTLSVQVHPPDDYARVHEGGEWGKTEFWYVVAAEKGAELVCGLDKGVGKEAFAAAVERGNIGEVLRCVKVKRGDVAYVPAGRVHAIGAGNLILEIQENSDVTYRVYDWGRVGTDGKPRALHIGKALQVVAFGDETPPLVEKQWRKAGGCEWTPLVRCRYFEAVEIEVGTEWSGMCDGSRFKIVSCVGGRGALRCGDPVETFTLSPGDTIFLPASLGAFSVKAEGECRIVQTEVP
jgi:mannose-6-phosphate isomerase